MQDQLSEILDEILGLLLLEGSYDVQEDDDGFHVSIETNDAGKLIGFRGESLSALQLVVNQIMAKKTGEGEFKRAIIDVSGWRENKEKELAERTIQWTNEVNETGKEIELEPMPSWQRRIIHMTVQDIEGVESESIGEGRERHLVIRPKS